MDFKFEGKGEKKKTAAEERHKYKKSYINIQVLPRDIEKDILSRLSIYSLFQCTLVCKEWRDIIAHDSHFATMQHNRALKNKNMFSLLFCSNSGHLYFVERGEVKQRKLTVIKSNLTDPYNDYLFSESCNGLLCVFNFERPCRIYVCNPITLEGVYLPEFTVEYSDIRASGFGFDSTTNKYKVVRVFKDRGRLKAKIYTLGTEAWREMEDVPKKFQSFFNRKSVVLVNGSLHWYWRCIKSKCNIILSLNMSKEQFGTVPAPKLEDHSPVLPMAWKGHLSLVQSINWDTHHIWVMKEYNVEQSWTPLFNVRRPRCLRGIVSTYSWPLYDESELDDEELEALVNNLRSLSGFVGVKVVTHIGSLVSLKAVTGKVNRMEYVERTE